MATTSKPPFLWTVMVYLAGDNNLTDESVFALTEMKQVNTDDRIAVIAQLDPKSGSIPSHRYVINRGPAARAVTGPRTIAADAIPIEEPTIKFRVAAGLKHSCSAGRNRQRGNRHWRSCDPLRLHQLDERALSRRALHGDPGRPWSGN